MTIANDRDLFAKTQTATYAKVAAAFLPVGTPRAAAVAIMTRNGWDCGGLRSPHGVISDSGSHQVMHGFTILRTAHPGFGGYPISEEFSAALLFQERRLAGLEVQQGASTV